MRQFSPIRIKIIFFYGIYLNKETKKVVSLMYTFTNGYFPSQKGYFPLGLIVTLNTHLNTILTVTFHSFCRFLSLEKVEILHIFNELFTKFKNVFTVFVIKLIICTHSWHGIGANYL
ncbi:hypothetical protein A8F95_21255 [Bacillus wudalianchiensis]|uniref:Uncharacterized protein n=1 Tax=Pseudobacillus wudalianchiensis TaxID=1743143 RepID=A0A1B9B2K5_9BACI|nr:hypothetical protein A8F95_21255 [Bacillus wudalianchiensis]